MIEAGRSYLSIVQQFPAVETAITKAKRTLIHDHLDRCLDHVVGAVPRAERGPIEEFKTILKYL